jgi:hypothetical protein
MFHLQDFSVDFDEIQVLKPCPRCHCSINLILFVLCSLFNDSVINLNSVANGWKVVKSEL